MVKQAMYAKSKWPALIKAHRIKLGETQGQFGQRFGVSFVAVHHWEKGTYDPPAEVIRWLYAEGVLTP